MKLEQWLKNLTLGLFVSLLVFPAMLAYAQPEEEEEEPIQARPNPMDSRSKMKGTSRSWDPFDKTNRDGKMKSGNPASMAQPAQQRQTGPQGMRPGKALSYDGVDGESSGRPMGMQPHGLRMAPQLQDDGEHGDMVMPQQMGQ